MGERLLDHQRSVLPPNRRHHHPVDGSHEVRNVLTSIRPEPQNLRLCRVKKVIDRRDELFGLKRSATMQAKLKIAYAIRDETLSRLEEDGNALPGIEVAEIPEYGPPARGSCPMGGGNDGGPTVRNDLD